VLAETTNKERAASLKALEPWISKPVSSSD